MKNFEEKIESRHFFIGKKKDIVRVCAWVHAVEN